MIEVVLLAVLIGSALSLLRGSNEVELTRRVQLGGRLLAAAAKDAVISRDIATLDSLLAESIASGQVDFVRILDATGGVLSQRGEARLLLRPFHQEESIAQVRDGVFDQSVPLLAEGIRQGEIQLGVSIDPLQVLLVSAQRWAAGIAAVEILLVALFSWLLGSYLVRQLEALRAASEHFAAGDFAYRTDVKGNDELAQTALAFNKMAEQLADAHERLRIENMQHLQAQQKVAKSDKLLREAISSIEQGFTLYDENDRLIQCNEAYLRYYETSRDLIVPGNTFEMIVRKGAERGQYQEAIGNVDTWVRQRVTQHQQANGQVIEQKLTDGRWLMIVEYRTPSGYIVGNRIDITELKTTSENLRQSELYLRSTLDNLPFYFWLKNAEGRHLVVNRLFAQACGRTTAADVLGLSDLELWPKEMAEGYRKGDLAVMSNGCGTTQEELVTIEGTLRVMETYKNQVLAADGSLFGTVGFSRDISERKRMEQALAASEQRWELAMIGANDGIWDWNPNTGQVYFSERWKSMLGFLPDEIGASVDEWVSRIHPDDLEYTMAEVQRHLAGETDFYQSEHRLLCKNGEYKWILDRGRVFIDEHGQPVRMVGSHSDVTERRANEARIREYAEQLKAIFDLSPDGFVYFDSARQVRFVSPAFVRMTGLEESQLLGVDETEFSLCLAGVCVSDAKFPGLIALYPKQINAHDADPLDGSAGVAMLDTTSNRRQKIEIAGVTKRVLEIDLREAPSNNIAQILYLRDVTHETEVDRLKSEFLATAAHELRTPMTSIYGFTELLLTQNFEETEQRNFLNTIFKQAELMVSIINELLDLARIDARRGKDFVIDRIDIRQLLRGVVQEFKTPVNRDAPREYLTDAPVWIMGDRNKLTQAILNVLSNAYKYSSAGGVVTIDLVPPILDDSAVVEKKVVSVGIRITDQGIGMTVNQSARVFERFYRVDTSGRIPGTGLGMSIVHEIVALHGGQVTVDSTPGVGTTVTIWVPVSAV